MKTPLFQGAAVMVSRANGDEPQQLLAEVILVSGSGDNIAIALQLSEFVQLGKDPMTGGMVLHKTLPLMRTLKGDYKDLWGQIWKVELA